MLGVVHLKDVVKGGIQERFARFRAMGIRTVMITGDNPRTAAAIAGEAGVDDFLAEATPEAKMRLIREEQAKGKLVAMTGDGTNDAPALAQADVGVAMNTGTQAAKEAGNMVDLDSNPTKLLEVVEVGKQLLMTRGSLTTFSIANDVAKYFAILPAMFMGVFPEIAPLNVMRLASPYSAILSAVIFNALIIILLIPLALRGVRYRPLGRGGAAPPLAAHLRRGRRHRAVRRHQGHRPRASGRGPGVGEHAEHTRHRAPHDARDAGPDRARLPARRHRRRAGALPGPANGSLVSDERGQVVGSELIGQGFASPAYFQPRPSAAGGTGTTRPPRRARTSARPRRSSGHAWRRARAAAGGEPRRARPVPAELVTASASGLDPHLSPAAALWQVPRVARARGVAPDRVRPPSRRPSRGATSASSASRASTCCS